MTLRLEKDAFIIGEEAKIIVDVSNMSRISIEEISLTLTRIMEFKTQGIRYEKTKEVLVTETELGVGAHGQKTLFITLKIPQSIVIQNLVKCNLIQESFRLRVSKSEGGISMMIETSIPTISNNRGFSIIDKIRCKLVGNEHTSIKSAKDTFEGHNEFLNLKMSLIGE
uniref:Uncharacterized protein LOC114346544 n=1 Tax=Diabrotica virgifera virgifera TaxID=50390 RepID=A0A6P7H3H6_DIAVI